MCSTNRVLPTVFCLLALALSAAAADLDKWAEFLDTPRPDCPKAAVIKAWKPDERAAVIQALEPPAQRAPGILDRAAAIAPVALYRFGGPDSDVTQDGVWVDDANRAIYFHDRFFEDDLSKDDAKAGRKATRQWRLCRAFATLADHLDRHARCEAWHALVAERMKRVAAAVEQLGDDPAENDLHQCALKEGMPSIEAARAKNAALAEFVAAIVVPDSARLPKGFETPPEIVEFVEKRLFAQPFQLNPSVKLLLEASLTKKPEESAQNIEKAIELDPRCAEAYYLRAVRRMARQKGDQALADLDKALDLLHAEDPLRHDVYVVRAQYHIGRKDWKKAIADYRAAIKLQPASGQAEYLLGRALLSTRKSKEAIPHLLKAVELLPSKSVLAAHAHYLLGRNFYSGRRYKEAAAQLDSALNSLPKGHSSLRFAFHLLRGKVRGSLNNTDGAIEDFAAAIAINPKDVSAYSSRASARRRLGKYKEAVADYDVVVKAKPKDSPALISRVMCKLELRDFAGAKADMAAVKGLIHPVMWQRMPDLHILRARCHAGLGDPAKALAEFDAISKRMPKYAPLRDARAWLLATCPDDRIRDGAKAVEDATQACEMTKWKKPRFLETLAAACAESGDFTDAAKWQKKAIELAKTDFRKRAAAARLELYEAGKPYRQPKPVKAKAAKTTASEPEPDPDTGVLQLTAPDGATVTINGDRYGTQRKFVFKPLEPGTQYVLKLRVGFPGGGEAQRVIIIQGGRQQRHSVMAPSRIVFTHKTPKIKSKAKTKTIRSLCIASPDGTSFRRLTNSKYSWENVPKLSPDGAKIAFGRGTRVDKKTKFTLHTANIDGTDERRIGEPDTFSTWEWSPDSTEIAFDTKGKIFIVNSNGSGRRTLTKGSTPCWSPDGSKITFDRYGANKHWGIFVINRDGSNERRLTQGAFPRWSPDGGQIVFIRIKKGPFVSIHLMEADGTNIRLLADQIKFDPMFGETISPRWSPDGTKVMFVDDSVDLYVINPDGSGRRKLKTFDDDLSQIQWSPDGSRILFELFGKQHPHPYTIKVDGTDMRPILRYQGKSSQSHWR